MNAMRRIRLVWTAFVIAAVGAAAWAEDGFEPPEIESTTHWYAIVAAVVALLAICVLAFKNSKRTHLD